MNDIEYMISKLLLWSKIPITITDSQDQILYYNEDIFKSRQFFEENPDLWDLLRERKMGQTLPVLYIEDQSYAYAVFRDIRDSRNYYLGPVPLGEIPRNSVWSYRGISRYFSARPFTERMTFELLVNYLHALYFAVYHRQMGDEEFYQANAIQKEQWEISEHDLLLSQIKYSDEEKTHHSYQMEQQWLAAVKEGRTDYIPGFDPAEVGEMATSSLKQLEYSCVCMITLLTRAAIEAGVSPGEAYGISDLYLQKLEKCGDHLSMQNLQITAGNAFMVSIQNAKKALSAPNYISTCKDYIATHRTKNLHVSEIAEALGMSHSYLTKRFKESEGITIQQYIIREKVKAAANMIKYSDASLLEISDYLNISSQSHMGQCFKKEYHMTPREYREKPKIIEFS